MDTPTKTVTPNKWNSNEKASWLWILLGLLGIGQLVALIYVLIKNEKNRVFALLFLLGWLGDIILYFVFKGKDEKLSSIAIKLFMGEIAIIVILLIFVAVVGVSFLGLFAFAGLSSALPHSVSSNLNSTLVQNPTTVSINGSSCGNFTLSLSSLSSTKTGSCSWSGGNLNITYATGNSGYAIISIVGNNGNTYFSNSTTVWGDCDNNVPNYIPANIPIASVNLPAQTYTIEIRTGRGGGSCGNAFVHLLS